jgi:hypothetical protein
MKKQRKPANEGQQSPSDVWQRNTVQTLLRLPPEMMRDLRERAAKARLTVSGYVATLLERDRAT